jgi:hypothetical protein
MANKRIFYATQSINLQPVSTGAFDPLDYRNPSHYVNYSGWIQPQGLQSAGITTTFNTEPVSQLGTLSIYSQIETSPEVEVTLNKLVDGTAPLYCLCVGKTTGSNLESINQDITEGSTNMVSVRIAADNDAHAKATGVAGNISTHTFCSGMYLNSVSFTFPVDGNATEQVTLAGSRKIWGGAISVPDGAVDAALFGGVADLVVRRQNVAITGASVTVASTRNATTNKLSSPYPVSTILPSAILVPYIRTIAGREDTPKVQNITVSANFNRENINELGFFGPYYKYTTFPIEVTSEFELVAISGDMVNANDFEVYTGNPNDETQKVVDVSSCGLNYSNTPNEEIVIKVCGATSSDALYLDLGDKNRLTSINYAGGDTGGGNATVTYSYQTFNKFNVIPVGSYANFLKHNGSVYSTGTLS